MHGLLRETVCMSESIEAGRLHMANRSSYGVVFFFRPTMGHRHLEDGISIPNLQR